MKLRLFEFISSPFCAKVKKILEYKGCDYEAIAVDYLNRGELLACSGQIMVPALQLPDGAVIVESTDIALKLEELYPEPTIMPERWRGIHMSLTRWIDGELEDTVCRVALPDEFEYWRKAGPMHLAFWKLIRDRKFGAGFSDSAAQQQREYYPRMLRLLAPIDKDLEGRAFLLGRIGLADFALYGQLWYLAFTGELKIPREFTNLLAFFDRMNRISSQLENLQS